MIEVPTIKRCVQFPETSVISVTVEAVAGGAPVEVGQKSRVGLPEPSTAIAPLSFLSHRRLSIRPISQFRPPSAAARAAAHSEVAAVTWLLQSEAPALLIARTW